MEEVDKNVPEIAHREGTDMAVWRDSLPLSKNVLLYFHINTCTEKKQPRLDLPVMPGRLTIGRWLFWHCIWAVASSPMTKTSGEAVFLYGQ